MHKSKLYKYRPFNERTLEILSEHQIWYSSPLSFNDPFECRPVINFETSNKREVLELLKLLLKTRGNDEWVLNYIQNLRELASYPDEDDNFPTAEEYRRLFFNSLCSEIMNVVQTKINQKGIFCLSEKWDCPLMWSHYADEHRGICIEFEKRDGVEGLKPVFYGEPSPINIDDIVQWCQTTSENSVEELFTSSYFTKCRDWSYEKEWRMLESSEGQFESAMIISGIYFGIRCPKSVKLTIANLVKGSELSISLNQMGQKSESLSLTKFEADYLNDVFLRVPTWYAFRNFSPNDLENFS